MGYRGLRTREVFDDPVELEVALLMSLDHEGKRHFFLAGYGAFLMDLGINPLLHLVGEILQLPCSD